VVSDRDHEYLDVTPGIHHNSYNKDFGTNKSTIDAMQLLKLKMKIKRKIL